MQSITKCTLCESDSRSLLGTDKEDDKYLNLIDSNLNKETRSWFRCNNCNFIYRSKVITEEEANILYTNYRTYDFRKITPQQYFDRYKSMPDDQSEAYSKAIYIKENTNNIQSILDVGCGGGILLWHLKRCFPESIMKGLEPNSEYAGMVRKNLEIEVIEDFYSENIINSSFDLTVSTDVIEHIHDVNIFWKAVNKNINTGKYLYIETPSSINFEILDISNDLFKSPHLYFFSKNHIENFANENGFILQDSKLVQHRGVYKDWYIFKKD